MCYIQCSFIFRSGIIKGSVVVIVIFIVHIFPENKLFQCILICYLDGEIILDQALLGFTPVEIAERLGHEKVEATLNIYAHVMPERRGAIADRLDQLYKEKKK